MASFLQDQPVVAEVVRNGLVESVHHGVVVGLDAAGNVALQVGDPGRVIYARSASKPIQAVAMLRSGLDLDGELLALAAGSHSGEAFHAEGARRILAAAGLAESALQCPPALPMEPDDLARYLRDGGEADAVLMNCSGKHAAMLATCVVNGWPTDTYTEPAHPLQEVIRGTLEEFTGDRITQAAVDGCGAPLFGFTLLGLARAFRALGLGAAGSIERRVADAYRDHPEWTSGTRREEARLMRAVPGLVNKAGAEESTRSSCPTAGQSRSRSPTAANEPACRWRLPRCAGSASTTRDSMRSRPRRSSEAGRRSGRSARRSERYGSGPAGAPSERRARSRTACSSVRAS